MTIKTEDVLKKFKQYNSYYCYGCEHSKIAINATVKETATGISQNATGTESQIVRGTAKLKFLPSTPKEFKPGMAYSGQVCITSTNTTNKKKTVNFDLSCHTEECYCEVNYQLKCSVVCILNAVKVFKDLLPSVWSYRQWPLMLRIKTETSFSNLSQLSIIIRKASINLASNYE